MPLTLLRKEQLRGFDLRDSHGNPMPVMARSENGTLAAAALKADLEIQARRPLTSEEWDHCFDVATLDPANAENSAELLEASIGIAGLSKSGLLARLQKSFVLMGVCRPQDLEQRQIIKLAYHWRSASRGIPRMYPLTQEW